MAQSEASRINCKSCGKALRWREELVGRRMKCTCGSMFVMPAAPGIAEATLAAPPASPTQPALPPLAAPEDPFNQDAFELDFPGGAGASSRNIGGTCPSCRAPMKSDAVLCVRCGFHTVTGRKLSTGTQNDGQAANAPRSRSERALLSEETDHRFTEIYLPVAMIVVGVIVTIIRAYTGMGELDAYDEADTSAYNSPLFEVPGPEGGDYFEEEPWDEAGGGQSLEDQLDLKKPADDSGADGDAPLVPDATEPAVDAQVEEEVQPPVQPWNSGPPTRAPPAPSTSSKGFNVSPLIVAAASLVFQLVVMVPFVFACVLFVAKYVDVTFGSLPSVLLKLTAIVLGPMAIADWIDDILLQATMGFGFVLAWTIRLVLVGSALIKLFDLDFFEAMVLMIVVAFVRFILAMFLVYALVSVFVA